MIYVHERISEKFGLHPDLSKEICNEVMRLPNGDDFERILEEAANKFECTEDDILKKTNYKNGKRNVTDARAYVVRKMKYLFPLVTYNDLSKFMNKYHTTIIDYFFNPKIQIDVPPLPRQMQKKRRKKSELLKNVLS